MKQGKKWNTWLKIAAKFVYQKTETKFINLDRKIQKFLAKIPINISIFKKTFKFLEITVEKITKEA